MTATEAEPESDVPEADVLMQVTGVTRRFGTDPPVEALRGVDLTVRDGDWVAIVGPSGSGKSTLLNILGCLDRPTEGSYHLFGRDAGALDDKERAAIRAASLGFVFQSFHLLSHRPVVENVMLAELYQGTSRRGRRERALAVLDRVGLSHRVDYLPGRLSGGERQRVAIARALLGSRQVLLSDEPTGNLDTATTASILELLTELSQSGITIVMITHSRDVATFASRRVSIIDGLLKENP